MFSNSVCVHVLVPSMSICVILVTQVCGIIMKFKKIVILNWKYIPKNQHYIFKCICYIKYTMHVHQNHVFSTCLEICSNLDSSRHIYTCFWIFMRDNLIPCFTLSSIWSNSYKALQIFSFVMSYRICFSGLQFLSRREHAH